MISRTGVTGAKDRCRRICRRWSRRVRRVTELPIAVGFGISLPGQVSVLGGLADAAVVGSALVEEIERAATRRSGVPKRWPRACDRSRGAAVAGMSRREPGA